jgi:hypothetical protein
MILFGDRARPCRWSFPSGNLFHWTTKVRTVNLAVNFGSTRPMLTCCAQSPLVLSGTPKKQDMTVRVFEFEATKTVVGIL